MNENIKSRVIKELMHNPGRSFNQLWDKRGESNTFAYQLKQLESINLIEKKGDGMYYLSQEGKELALFVDGSTGKKQKRPLVSLLLVVFQEDGSILLHERLKEPFFGYFGFPGAKVDFGEQILQCAKRELMEETNLEADLEEVGLLNYITYENKNIAFHHTQFVIKCINPKGILKEKDREGNFCWVSKEEFLSKNLFPDDPYILDWIKSDKYFRVEMDRFQEEGKFKEITIHGVKYYGKN
jgi:ADP-ribose pyrophosphatase YjhB (NUDIX family)